MADIAAGTGLQRAICRLSVLSLDDSFGLTVGCCYQRPRTVRSAALVD